VRLTEVPSSPPPPIIDPSDPSFVADPYPAYANVREATPVWHPEGSHLWFLTRYQEVHAGFRDKRLATSFLHRFTPEELHLPPGVPTWRDPRWTEFQAFERWELLNLEPPEHTRMRRLVLEAFTPRATEALRGPTTTRAAELLAAGREVGSVDLVGGYAKAFSLSIICDLIGVAPADRLAILAYSDALLRMYEPDPPEAQQAAANAAAGDFRRYLLDVIAVRRRTPGADLLDALINCRVAGEALTDQQIASTAMVLLMAGHEAVVNATANGIAALAAHPEAWRQLRAGEVHPRDAIEDIVRWDPPLQWFERWVLDDVVYADTTIPRGARVALVLAAANRDPRRYADPDRFDIRRGDSNHLSFGGGIHFCIGAPLARLELETTIRELLRSEVMLEILPGATRKPTFQFRGYDRLEVALHPL